MIGVAIVNGIAFTGAGELFRMFDKNGYAEEMKRHNLAQEQLNKATAEWEQHRKQTIDYVNLQLQKEHQASIDFQSVDNALDYYNELHPLDKVSVWNRPVLNEYYQYLWIVVGMVGLGGAVYYFKH